MKPIEEIAQNLETSVAAMAAFDEAAEFRIRVGTLRELATALRAERERAERAEAELRHLKETEGVEWLSTRTIDRLQDAEERAEKAEAERDEVLWDARYQIDAQVRSREAAETALATARNRALEEAAQARPVTPHGSPKSWEQGYADGTSEFADAILALRTKEGE